MKHILSILIAAAFSLGAAAQVTDCGFNCIGRLALDNLALRENDITVGCEVLDRGYADYNSYKEYLAELGIRKIRIQAGWARTEKEKAVYDFAWLDEIIEDAVSRGMEPWLQTSYGNPLYPGGGTPVLSGGYPESEVALEAWDRWVTAMAERYKGKVHEWEIWNEPDLTRRFRNDPMPFVELTVRTAECIRRVDPEARIAAFAWAGWRPALFSKCMSAIKASGSLELFDWISYHFYTYRPEEMYAKVEAMQDSLSRYSSKIKLRQGETGAPSKGYMGGALDKYDWTEVSQAKWDLRRMLSDKARGIPTTVFSISDMNYQGSSSDAIRKKNVKGLLETDDANRVLRPKQAYYAIQNLVCLWPMMERLQEDSGISVSGQGSWSLYPFKYDKKRCCFVLWEDSAIPSDAVEMTKVKVTIPSGAFRKPCAVDVRTGLVYALSAPERSGGMAELEVPAYDSPVLVTDRNNLCITPLE